MVQKIALFNPKGGVGKTTITLNLGWMLAVKGKRVILVDTDPQCDLTRIMLDKDTEEDEARSQRIYGTIPNIKSGLAPAFESQPKAIEAVDCIPVQGCGGLFLLPGSLEFSEYEVPLGIAQEIGGSVQSLRNIPGAIADLLNKTSDKFNADYLLIDMSPYLGSINQNLLMTSDFFIIPTIGDFFSTAAISSLSRVLPKWYAWGKAASSLQILKNSTYPFPEVTLRFLGTVIQIHRTIRGKETSITQDMVQRVERAISTDFIPILRQIGIALPEHLYHEHGISDGLSLAKIPNFDSLIALSQQYATPIYNLTSEQLEQEGGLLENNRKKQEEFRQTFSDLADKVIALSSASSTYAVSA